MNPSSYRIARHPGLWILVLSGLGQPLTTTPLHGAITEAWATNLQAAASTFLSAGGLAVGPAGDLYVAAQVSSSGVDADILLSRHHASGNPVWQRQYEPEDSPASAELASAVAARGALIVVAGTITSTNGAEDFLTLKYQDTGDLEWARRFDGEGHSTDRALAVAVDGLGNVIVAGNSAGATSIFDLLVVKYGPGGDLLWSYRYDGPGEGPETVSVLRLDAAGNIHLTGTSTDLNSYSEAVTLKLDPDGQPLWIAREGSSFVWGIGVAGMDLDAAGNVVTVGTDRSHAVAWKYDAGNREWIARYRAEEPASMLAAHARFDAGGNVLMAAYLYGSGTNDTVIVKFGPDGTQLWASRVADPQNGVFHVHAFAVDSAGNAFITSTPATDLVTVQMGPDGTQLGSATYGAGNDYHDSARFLEVDGSDNLLLAGRSAYFGESGVPLVKYTQQQVAGLPIARVAPALHLVDPGASIVFTAQVTGTGPAQVQWRKNGRAIPGATGPTFALTDAQVGDRGDYSVIVSNPAGSTVSTEARLSVRTPPEVSIAPADTLAYAGTDTTFLATVAGNDFVVLQWRHDGAAIPGATNETLRFDSLQGADAGAYDVVATTAGGSITSSAAGLRISAAVELLGNSLHRSFFTTWQFGPQLRVLPNGDSVILARTNIPATAATLLLSKLDAAGGLLWSASVLAPGVTNAEPAGLELDAAGNIYVTGVSGEPYPSIALIAAKYSPDGQLQWFHTLDDPNQLGVVIACLAVDPDGNSTIGMLGHSGTTLIRHDAAGDVQWSIHDPTLDDDTLSITVDASGNSYIGTTIRLEGGGNEIRLRRIDAAGEILWTRTLAGSVYVRLSDLAVDPSGHLIAAATGDVPMPPGGRMIVAKFTPEGDRLWLTRGGGDWPDFSYVAALAVGAGGEITVLAGSDDDAPREHSRVIGLTADGQPRFLTIELDVVLLLNGSSQLAIDAYGNAYITGYGGRPGTGGDVVTAKYNSKGKRLWLVYHSKHNANWEFGISLGVDAAGDVRVLATTGYFGDSSSQLSLLHYRQWDPTGTFRLQLIRDAGGTFHLSTPTSESFRIQVSTDLQDWSTIEALEAAQLLQPGGGSFSESPQRHFRLIGAEE